MKELMGAICSSWMLHGLVLKRVPFEGNLGGMIEWAWIIMHIGSGKVALKNNLGDMIA